jgi:phosphate-selective porin OprO/OprP
MPATTASSEASESADAPVVEQLLDLLRAKGDISDEQYEELLKKARKEESANQEKKALPQAAEAEPKTKVTTNYNGLTVSSPDGRFKFNVGGRVQVDWAVFDQDITPLGDGMELRRARLKAEGTMYKDFKFKLEANFDSNGDVSVTDAWVSYQGFKPLGLPLVLTAGHQKVPFSQQSMTSSNWQVFQERSMQDSFIDNPAMGRRRLGFIAHSYGEHWMASAGLFAEGINDRGDQNQGFGTAGRLLFYPFIQERKLLTVGGAVYYREWRQQEFADDYLRFRARPESYVANRRLINTGWMSPLDGTLMYNVEVSGLWGSFHAQGEYTGASVRRVGKADLSFGGWYVQAGYFLTGENRVYDRKSGKYKRVVPKSMVGEGGFGAWEVAARYSEMDLTSGDIAGGKERNVTLGVNWWMNRSFMIRLSYIYANPDPTTSEALIDIGGAGMDQNINIVEGRFQVVF